MERQREPGRESRRGFLKKLALLGASMTALVTAKGVATEGQGKSDEPALAETTGKGYRLTAHISKYYETARR
ncbi:MAG TPA: twin-arginine translocation signal domain-containing protein [Syntrophobacteria bacterium]|nr:twin-arginine translocation signal domain-containing protein [Syntrophobacteria bacterium]